MSGPQFLILFGLLLEISAGRDFDKAMESDRGVLDFVRAVGALLFGLAGTGMFIVGFWQWAIL